MASAVSYLFVPGSRPDRFARALAAGADAVILDLEDAVAPEAKPTARDAVGAWLQASGAAAPGVLVRVNDAGTPWFVDDLAMLQRAGARGLMLPKAEHLGPVERAAAALGTDGRVVALVETAGGLHSVHALAGAAGVERLALGTLDLALDLNLSGDERGLLFPASLLALASRCAGKAAPVAGVTPAIGDDEALARDIEFARAVGFTAKLCIHPRQVEAVNHAFAPRPAEIEWARRVVAAAGSAGAVQVDGRMVDRPVVLKARAILERVRPDNASPTKEA
jgi:citrate lyase subunit beta/citryl-CoA lyase